MGGNECPNNAGVRSSNVHWVMGLRPPVKYEPELGTEGKQRLQQEEMKY